MGKNRLNILILIALLLTTTACSNNSSGDSETRNPDSIISETKISKDLKVLELDTNHENNKKVLDVFNVELKDGVYAYDEDKYKTYILINSINKEYSDFSYKLDKDKKILTLSYKTSEGKTTNNRMLFVIESEEKNQYEEIKLVNNGNDDGFLGVFTK
ncbi:hypothetical protein ACFVP8_21360 [Viridibacillus arvi]|uniref:hypothetical protein n=1 Tax=Viridibacillus arvi TaxID=263475 RepID=UPI0036D0F98A